MKKNILISGPLLSNSGYGVHSRQVFSALQKRKNINLFCNLTSWGNTSWHLKDEEDETIISDIIKTSAKKKNNIIFDESYQISLPNEWKVLADKNIGITAGFEADIVKKSWIDHTNQMNEIITPSEFTKSSFLKTLENKNIKINTPIVVINESFHRFFEDENFNKHLLDDLEYNKNILILGQITSNSPVADRKNIFKTIKVAIEFVRNKDIGILLKVNFGKNSKYNKRILLESLKEKFLEKDLKKIIILSGNFSTKELNSLYRSEKTSCLLSGTRGEGWGLPFLESAACGLPIIATNYSAYKEFLEDDFEKIDYKLVSFNYDVNFVDIDAEPKWAEFLEESMLNSLDVFFKNIEKYREMSLNRKKIIKQSYNESVIIKKYLDFFDKI